MNKVIGITGQSGSGKSTLVGIIRENYPCSVVDVNWVMHREARRLGYARLSDFMGAIGAANVFRLFAPEVMRRIRRGYASSNVIVDGLYDVHLAEDIRKAYGKDSHIINLKASERTRECTIALRNNSSLGGGALEAERRDAVKRQAGMDRVTAMADLTISNDGGIADLRREALRVLRRVQ